MDDPPRMSPTFLERRSYRRRRLLDALRLLPFFGVWLFMLPILWPSGAADQQDPTSMSYALVFVFSVWLFLIVLGAGLVALVNYVGENDDPSRADPGAQ